MAAKFSNHRWWVYVPLLLALVYAAGQTALGSFKYEALLSRQPDLAAMDQAVWATLKGVPLHTTVYDFPENYLGFQVAPILILLAPLDLLFHDARVLIGVQSVALGAAIVPVGWWARKRLGNGLAAAIIATACLLSPVFSWGAEYPFYQLTLAPVFLGLAFFFQLERKWRWFWPCLLLALAVKDEIGFVAAAMGVYAVLVQGQRKQGAGIIVAGLAWVAFSLGFVLPWFDRGAKPYFGWSFSYLGTTPGSIALNALLHPALVASHIFTGPKLFFALFLLATFGLLPLLGWRTALIALPTLGYLILGDKPERYDIHYFYALPMVPFLAFATIEGLARLRRWVPLRASALFLLVAAGGAYYVNGGGPGTQDFGLSGYTYTPHAARTQAMLNDIPAGASVSATPNLLPHVARRWVLHLFPEVFVPTDVIAIDFKGWDGWHGYPANFNDYDQALRRVLQDPAYAGLYQGDGLALLRRDRPLPPPQHTTSAVLGGQIALVGWSAPAELRAGHSATFHLYWHALTRPQRPYTVFLHFGTPSNDKLAQRDSWPWDGWFPTSEWAPGEQVDDPHTVALPASLPAGTYRLAVGMYSLDHDAAVPLKTANGQSGVVLGPFTVQAAAS